MATANAQRFLSTLDDDRKLALKTYWGVLLEAFHAKTLLWNSVGGEGGEGESAPPVVVSRNISGSSAHRFPIFGNEDAEPEYHTPGTELLGQQFEVDEGQVSLDDLLVAHKDVAIDQLTVSHFDILSPVGKSNGRALAKQFDQNLFVVGYRAALEPAKTKRGMTIHNGGHIVTQDAATLAAAYPVTEAGALAYIDDVAHLAQLYDDSDVPEENRFLAINPYIKRVLSKAPDRLFSRDYDGADQNMANRRKIGLIEGFNVMTPTKHLPQSNVTHKYDKYAINATAANDGICAGLAFAGADEGAGAIGYVTAGGIMPALVNDERRNTVFLKAQMMVGADILAPWHAGAIRVKSS